MRGLINNKLECTSIWKEAVVGQLRVLAQHLSEGSEEDQWNLHQVGLSRGRDLNPGTLKHEAGMLSTRTRRSVVNTIL
jgi:hypothetical protein